MKRSLDPAGRGYSQTGKCTANMKTSQLFFCRPSCVRVRRKDALSQIINLLEVLALGDHQVALPEQNLQCAFGRLPIPPRSPLHTGREFKVFGCQGTFNTNTIQNLIQNMSMFLLPFAEPCPLARAVSLHPRDVEAVIGHWEKRDRMCPVFEDTIIDGYQIVEEGRLIVRAPCPKRVMMCALDHSDGIDLNIAQMLNDLSHAFLPGERTRIIKLLCSKNDASRLFKRKLRLFHIMAAPRITRLLD